jgi:methylated-DNA-protein-cysteine methyltransferase related protein
VVERADNFFERVYADVTTVPAGRVTTYGDVSRRLFGHARAARTVGWALHGLPAGRVETVPWWRVINAQGRISTSCAIHTAAEQRARLEEEGIVFGRDDRVDLACYGFEPEAPPRR